MPTKKNITKHYSYESFKELLAAIESKDPTKVYYLIKNGANANATNENGRTMLMAAITTNDLAIVKVLVKAGADLEAKAHDKETAFLYACRITPNVDIIKYLVKVGANVQARNEYGDNGLFLAAEYNTADVVNYLIKTKQFDINDQKDRYKYTPLMAAARFNRPNVVCALLNNGADVWAQDKSGWYPMYHAVVNKYDNPTNLVLLCGITPQLLAEDVDNGPLQSLAERENNNCVYNALEALRYLWMYVEDSTEKRIAESGPTVEEENEALWQKMHQPLLDDINARIAEQRTIPSKTFIAAVKDGVQLDLIKKMIPLCKDINARDRKGRTALHYCATNNIGLDILQVLIKAGIDVSIQDRQGKTALDLLNEDGLWNILFEQGEITAAEFRKAKRLFAGKCV